MKRGREERQWVCAGLETALSRSLPMKGRRKAVAAGRFQLGRVLLFNGRLK